MRSRPLKVVADTANGMGGLVVPKVFEGLPFDLHVLFGELDGIFPNHPADPIQPENLVDLKKAVLESRCGRRTRIRRGRRPRLSRRRAGERGVGITHDGARRKSDARAASRARRSFTTSSARVWSQRRSSNAGAPVSGPGSGHSFIKQVMAETNAVFGGEHSGHYYFRDNFRADSGIIAAMVVLGMMSTIRGRALGAARTLTGATSDSGEVNLRAPRPCRGGRGRGSRHERARRESPTGPTG